jgi:hypothetical protein
MIRQNKTTIIHNEKNVELINVFLEANNLISAVEVSSYKIPLQIVKNTTTGINTELSYDAISINYDTEDDVTHIRLINLAMVHSGIDNMFIDYLMKLRVSPILMNFTPYVNASTEDFKEYFDSKIAPRLSKNRESAIKKLKEIVPVEPLVVITK